MQRDSQHNTCDDSFVHICKIHVKLCNIYLTVSWNTWRGVLRTPFIVLISSSSFTRFFNRNPPHHKLAETYTTRLPPYQQHASLLAAITIATGVTATNFTDVNFATSISPVPFTVAAGAGFLRELRFPLHNLHSISFSTIIFTITRSWHNRPGVAAVPIASQNK
jgi:hypothetical protein